MVVSRIFLSGSILLWVNIRVCLDSFQPVSLNTLVGRLRTQIVLCNKVAVQGFK